MKLATLSLGLALIAGPALADPTGSYTVEGKSPGGAAYRGSAVITKTGETYKVTWTIGNEKTVGTAVGDDRFFAVGYRQGAEGGIAVYARDGKDWKGIWSQIGGTEVGIERLTPK